MPTPSSPPEPQTPYTFSSTCPEPDEIRHDTQMDVSIEPEVAAPISRPAVATAHAHFATGDGPVPVTSSSPDHPSPPEPGKDAGIDLARTASPYDPLPIEDFRTSRPKQGVGTSIVAPHTSGDDSSPRSQPQQVEYATEPDYMLPSLGRGFPSQRVLPNSPSSFLRPGSRFAGTQQSEKQVYDVQVEIKYVDLRESYLCGYLRIQGLTDDHPTLTTFFEGEIIGAKYGFITKHDNWGANEKTDLSHWSKFPAFRPYAKQARRGTSIVIKDIAQSEHIFMRWKEHFLVPDHRVRTITGASFEGFYYICFNQILGVVNGIYFHSKSERFQQLELKHVEDRGCFSALEFR